MSTPEHPDGPLAPWQPEPLPAVAVPPAWDDYREPLGPEPHRRFTIRVVARAVRRHWWQILLLWGISSGALVALAYTRVNPTYDAIAYIQIDPPANIVVAGGGGSSASPAETQLETQAQRILTPDVLGPAIADPKVAILPRIASAVDPETMLRKELRVQIVPRTRFITVGLTATSSEEAVAIVNAVARAYEQSAAALALADISKQTKRVESFLDKTTKDVEDKRGELRDLVKKASGPIAAPATAEDGDKPADELIKTRGAMPMEEFRSYVERLTATELGLLDAEKKLDRLKAQRRALGSPGPLRKLNQAVDEQVRDDPRVAQLADQLDRALQQKARAEKLVHPTDPALIEARRRARDLAEEYRQLVERQRAALRPRLERALYGDLDKEIREAGEQVASLQGRQEGLQKKLKNLKVEDRRARDILQKDQLEIDLARQELNTLTGLQDHVQRELQQLRFEAENSGFRVNLILAKLSPLPTTNLRTKVMAAAPVATLALVLGLFVLLEAGAGRVADPDDLPGRLRLGVIGVVPPLPSASPARGALPWGNDQDRARRKVEEFVQSLDHLRVQLWAGRRPGAGHRCVLITSACVSEGKTTLAAQLAGRCANAGLSTLLIDADLRRPALARLLEVPEAPGLADILASDIEPETAMAVVGNAGGFHLMPAGTTGQDPSRLLQGDRFGALLARLRTAFDMIIVDAPPILPVPDALLLGRWTDGAVLAVRHDSSRYPMVERAQHKLGSVGIPILGVVVNGVRGVGSTYGAYSYSAQNDRGMPG